MSESKTEPKQPSMVDQFFDALKNGVQALRDSAPGQLLGGVYDALGPSVAHGAHELAAALFSGNGNAFVMYQHSNHQNEQNAPSSTVASPEIKQSESPEITPPETPEITPPEREQGRGR